MDYLPDGARPARIAFDGRLRVGGRTYEVTATDTDAGPLNVRLVGRRPDGEVTTEVTGTMEAAELPAMSDFLRSTVARLAPFARRPSSLESKRRTHPNLGARWTEDEERRLVARHREGATVEILMAEFGRNRGGIVSRLVRLGVLSRAQWLP